MDVTVLTNTQKTHQIHNTFYEYFSLALIADYEGLQRLSTHLSHNKPNEVRPFAGHIAPKHPILNRVILDCVFRKVWRKYNFFPVNKGFNHY